MGETEIFYIGLTALIIYILLSLGLYFIIKKEQKVGILKKIEDFILFYPERFFNLDGVISKGILGILTISVIFFLIIRFVDCDAIIEKFAPCNPTDSAQYSYNVVNSISGIITPIFSFIALVVAYKTFIEDRDTNKKALQQQSDSFEQEKDYNKKTLDKQNESFQEGKNFNEKSLLLQEEELFINELFNMLQTQRVILNGVSGSFSYRYSSRKGIVSGSNYFSAAINELYSIFDVLNKNTLNKQGEKISKKFKNNISERYNLKSIENEYLKTTDIWYKVSLVYGIFYSKHPELGDYFRYLSQILSRIKSEENRLTSLFSNDSTKMDEVKKKIEYYLDSFRSTLTRDELVMLNYNCHLNTWLNLWLLVYNNDFLKDLEKSDLYDRYHFIG